jgi:hypothetical protein
MSDASWRSTQRFSLAGAACAGGYPILLITLLGTIFILLAIPLPREARLGLQQRTRFTPGNKPP